MSSNQSARLARLVTAAAAAAPPLSPQYVWVIQAYFVNSSHDPPLTKLPDRSLMDVTLTAAEARRCILHVADELDRIYGSPGPPVGGMGPEVIVEEPWEMQYNICSVTRGQIEQVRAQIRISAWKIEVGF